MTLKLVEQHKTFEGEQFKYNHYSDVLQCEMTFSLYLPANKDNKKIPLIWFLSGLTCTDDNFGQKSGFQAVAAKHQVAVMIPDTSPRGEAVPNDDAYDLGQGAGFYVDATEEPWSKNYNMYTYITEELPAIAHKLIPNFSGNESIMGHSMGGHGALVLGMKNTDQYKSISAFAPITNPIQVSWGKKAFSTYLGEDQATWQEWDAAELIKKTNAQPILISQGTADNFYPEQLEETTFLENARENNQNVQFNKEEGYDHSYFFISTFLDDHFSFHMKNLV